MAHKKSDICLAHALRRADRVVIQIYNEHLAFKLLHWMGRRMATLVAGKLTH